MAPRNDGLDLSNHQRPDEIDWPQVPVYPLMAHKATEGKGYRDPFFVDRWRTFAARGHRYRAAYHWIRSDSPPAAQVANLTATLEATGSDTLRPGEFVQLDWETTPGIVNVTATQVDEWLTLFRARWGDRVCVYSSAWVPGFTAWRAANPDVPVWYADYRPEAGRVQANRYGATLWQWTSTLRVPGISEGVDANEILRPDVLDRITEVSVTTFPPATPQPPSGFFRLCSDSPLYGGVPIVVQLVGNRAVRIEPAAWAVYAAQGDVPDEPGALPPITWADMTAAFTVEASPL